MSVTSEAEVGAALTAVPAPTKTPTLYKGDAGSSVVELQKLLNIRGFKLVVDGFFGPSTKTAVVAFQENHGLTIDGIVSPTTWIELRRCTSPIRLEDVCLFYNPLDFPHQAEALEWLQNQISSGTLAEFARRWQNHTATSNTPTQAPL